MRNSLEDFHVKHLTDAQMKELNPIIRNAIYDALLLTEEGLLQQMAAGEVPPAMQQSVGFLAALIPDYWEETTREEAIQRLRFVERDGELSWAETTSTETAGPLP
ncbi:MAG: hypothetical protein KGJ86_14850 [Chloroflexota bacterium]|nr:hypothetical protein [Chloroflexota bacterium]